MKTEVEERNKLRIHCIKRLFPDVANMEDGKILKALKRANNKATHAVDQWRKYSGQDLDANCKKVIFELYEVLGEYRCKMWRLGICVDAAPKLRLLNTEQIHINLREKMGWDAQGVYLFVNPDTVPD